VHGPAIRGGWPAQILEYIPGYIILTMWPRAPQSYGRGDRAASGES
jgi:hypothetical protein